MAKKNLMDTLLPRPSVEDLDRIAEQIHQSGTGGTPNARSAGAAKKLSAPVENEQHRLTIDLPRWLVETIRSEGKKNGITVRGMILSVLLEKFEQ